MGDETSRRIDQLADWLGTAGAIVGGSAAVFGTLGFIYGSLARDMGQPIDPLDKAAEWAERGGVFGLAMLIWTILGVP